MFARQQVDNPLYIGSAMFVFPLGCAKCFPVRSIDFLLLWVFVRDRGLCCSFRQPRLTSDRSGLSCDTILCQVAHRDAVCQIASNKRVSADPKRFEPTRARSDRKWCLLFYEHVLHEDVKSTRWLSLS